MAQDLGLVHKYSSPYSSSRIQNSRELQKENTIAYLESTFLSNDGNESFCLKDLYDRSASNPTIRCAELMSRINGFEFVAKELGDIGEFYTIITPSRMHARLNRRGIENPKYAGMNPREVQEHLVQMWSCIRAKLHKEGIYIDGFRVAEANQDGTLHWHILMLMATEYRSYQVKITLMTHGSSMANGEKVAALKVHKDYQLSPAMA